MIQKGLKDIFYFFERGWLRREKGKENSDRFLSFYDKQKLHVPHWKQGKSDRPMLFFSNFQNPNLRSCCLLLLLLKATTTECVVSLRWMICLNKLFHDDDAIWRARLLIQNRFEEKLSVAIKRTKQYPSIDLVIPLNASKDCTIYIYNVCDQRTAEMKRRADRSLDKKHSASQLDKLRRWDEYRMRDVRFDDDSPCSIPHTVVHPKYDRSLLDWRNWKSYAMLTGVTAD